MIAASPVHGVLFVDDEVSVLQGLRRMLRPMRDEWNMEFAPSGQDALDVLARASIDVVVTDMRMPGMDGAQLLTEVMNRHPHVVRIILSGQADRDAVIRCVSAAHQWLAKPCDPDTLKGTIARACRLRGLLADAKLQELVSRIGSLPALPATLMRVLEACRSQGASLITVGELIAEDPGMTAKILQVVNSAFFGLRRRVSSPVHAVQLLGLDTVTALLLSAQAFSRIDERSVGTLALTRYWEHSVTVGSFARLISGLERMEQQDVDDAGLAGLLHDAGLLVLATKLPDQYRRMIGAVRTKGVTQSAAEVEIFGVGHGAVGAYLLGLWALPDSVVEAVGYCDRPREAVNRHFGVLTVVHVADALAAELGPSDVLDPGRALDTEMLTELGVIERLPVWREACRSALAEVRDE